MKLQLNGSTLNAYINEALKQEIDEAASAVRKLGQAAGGDLARMARKKTPLKFATNARRAKSARLGLRDFRKGRAVEGKIDKGPFKGSSYFVKKENGVTKFYSDANCTSEITDSAMLRSAKSSWGNLTSHAKNLRNSARRNAAGTAAVAGAGIGGYTLGRGSHQDDPWNDTSNPESSNSGGESWDGSFPWDDTTPVWTQRPAKTTPVQTQQQAQPAQSTRPQLTPIQPVQNPTSMPTGVSMTQGIEPGLSTRQSQPSLAQQAVHVMGQTANQSNMGLNDRRSTNARTKQNVVNAINQAKNDGSMTRQQARNDKKLVRGAEKTLRTGQPMSE